MIGRETMQLVLTKPFSLRERVRILFGFQLRQIALVEITAKGILRSKEVKITYETKGVQAFLGKPDKTAALPALQPPGACL